MSTEFKLSVNDIDRFPESHRVQEHEQDVIPVSTRGKPASNMGELANIQTIPLVFPRNVTKQVQTACKEN